MVHWLLNSSSSFHVHAVVVRLDFYPSVSLSGGKMFSRLARD
jgi:hypothetical protein